MTDDAAPVVHYQEGPVTLIHGNCLDALREMPDASVDAVITDPPYGLANTTPGRVVETLTRWAAGDREFIPEGAGFMGRRWDAFVPPPAVWDECYRVLKPGGHLLAFAGARTFDLMGISVRFAGFDIRDGIAWLYGSGFPKSHDVSKGIDRLDAAEARHARAQHFTAWMRTTGLTSARINELTNTDMGGHYLTDKSQPHVATADLFDVLRPHMPEVPEDIEQLVAERTVESQNYAARAVTGQHTKPAAAQVWRNNVDGGGIAPATERRDEAHTEEARRWQGWGTALKPAFEPIVVAQKPFRGTVAANVVAHGTGAINIDANRIGTEGGETTGKGRWPANIVLDESQAAELDRQAPTAGASGRASGPTLAGATSGTVAYGARGGTDIPAPFYGDTGGASRFFYVAKAPGSERPEAEGTMHATVKPLALMQRLIRLVTPPGGTVLEPFAGSGTTLEAALREGFDVVGIEREAEYLPLITQRLDRHHPQTLFGDL